MPLRSTLILPCKPWWSGGQHLPRHEFLHRARGEIETDHRKRLHHVTAMCPFYFCTRPNLGSLGLDDSCNCGSIAKDIFLSQIPDSYVVHCYNKSVPIFVTYLSGRRSPPDVARRPRPPVPLALHNWLYHQWFQPYRSDIEFRQFIAYTAFACDVPRGIDNKALASLAVSMGAALCGRADEYLRMAKTSPEKLEHLYRDKIETRDKDFYLVRPLFRAMVILMIGRNYTKDMKDIGRVPVLIVLTGNNEGLSAPISFEPIASNIEVYVSDSAVQASLETATAFVMDLQRREDSVFGPRPDPVEATGNLKDGFGGYAKYMTMEDFKAEGWGDEQLEGPSSRWVDTDLYPKWSGRSAHDDVHHYTWFENLYRRMALEQEESINPS